MNQDEFLEILQFRAEILLADAELEDATGITPENREEYYELMLKDWENPKFLQESSKENIRVYYDHVTESLDLLDSAKELEINTEHIACLDEKYRNYWVTIQKLTNELLRS